MQIMVYDILGKQIIRANEMISAGKNIFRIDLARSVTGIYLMECSFTNLKSGEQTKSYFKLNLSY